MSNPLLPEERARLAARYETARRTAIVSAVFSLLVVIILAASGLPGSRTDPLTQRMVGLKAELNKRPNDAHLISEIRALDQRTRVGYFRRRALSAEGGFLLLAGIAIFILSAKTAKQLRKKLPMPGKEPVPDAWGAAADSRSTVTVLGLVAGAVLLLFAFVSWHDIAFDYGKAVGVKREQARTANGWASSADMAKNWPLFRGPRGLGLVTTGSYPEQWDGPAGKGIRWKTPVPLPGKNSPIVWENRVFLTGATADQHVVYCFDADSGKKLWEKPVGAGSHTGAAVTISEDTGYAAPTMATDGRRVYAIFALGDVAALSMDGDLVWMRSLGAPESMYGYSASLALWHNRLIIQYDQGSDAESGKSALLALDTATGEDVYRVPRPVPNSWSSPIVVDTGKGDEIITCGNPWVIGYDPATGKEKWRASGLSGDVAPTPVYSGGMVIAVNTGCALLGIRAGGTGDITQSGVAWTATDNLPDIVSPLADCGLVWLTTSDGMVTCFDITNGSKVWEHPFDKPVRSSPARVGRYVYLTDREGVTHLFEASKTFGEAGQCPLGEEVETSPAFAAGRIYIRGKSNLYCIGK